MKTKIIISKGWKIIKEYDFLITMTNEDVVEFDEINYKGGCEMCYTELKLNDLD